MSDFYQTLVVSDALDGGAAPHDGPALVRLLQGWGVVGQEIVSAAHLAGHPAGVRAREFVSDPPKGWPRNWTGRTALVKVSRDGRFHGDINEPADATCPRCGAVTRNLEWYEEPLFDALRACGEGTPATFRCPACGSASDVEAWAFEPPIALGTAAVDFINWPQLSQRLIDELAAAVGRPVRRVRWSV